MSNTAAPESNLPDVPIKPDVSQRPISPDWQKECKRFGAWLAGASFVAALAWLTGAHALVPLTNGKVIHASYVGWPLILMVIGMTVGLYCYLAASHEWLPIPSRRRVGIDHSYRYSLLFNSPSLRFELYDGDDANELGVQVGVNISNGFSKPIQVYIEKLDVIVNDVKAEPLIGGVRQMRILPNQVRKFMAPTIKGFPQGYFNGVVDYSILYGPLDTDIMRVIQAVR
jgi:hypothetical protein